MAGQPRPIQLNRKEYRNKVRGCWLGKNIGGTLGGPFEGHKYVNALTFYSPVPKEPQPNDDLDLQLVWLKMLEDIDGRAPTLSDFADYWLKYLWAYPFSEYGVCLQNLERGLRAPVCGCFENGYVDCMGSPIRSEIWACVAPGDPQLAAVLACRDALLDHAGGEGVWGEMFWAAIQSAAFIESDTRTLIRLGLSMIPQTSHISRAIREVLWCYDHGLNWAQARQQVVERFSSPLVGSLWQGYAHPSLAAPNHGFTVIGWLYGKDFGDKILTAVNCGLDTDCTGATLGALLGIIGGAGALPARWVKPVGEKIVLHKFTGPFNHPKTIAELTKRTEALAEKMVIELSDTVELGAKTIRPKEVLNLLARNERAWAEVNGHDLNSAVATDGDVNILFHYGREPILYPKAEMAVRVSVYQNGKPVVADGITLAGPKAWTIVAKGLGSFGIYAKSVPEDGYLTVKVKYGAETHSARFILLSPEKTTGYLWGVQRCPVCDARKGSCLCKKS